MEDYIQIIVYIVFVLIAVISRALKGKKQKSGNRPKSSRPQANRPQQDPVSFEELLKEFTQEGGNSGSEQRTFSHETEYEPKDVLEIDDDEIRQRFERSIVSDDSREEHHDDRHTGNFQHFEHYSEEDTAVEASEFAKLMNDPDEARKAIILSEIINRKYQ